jgi:methionyl-tRNA formyltransferase
MDDLVIATIKSWNIANAREFKHEVKDNYNVHIVTDKDILNLSMVQDIDPKFIFFPHWSWKIPPEIYENFECVLFHMTDLPFGRGGSPLQNLIQRGYQSTKISAIRVIEELDAGPIYMKKDLCLHGTAEEILTRSSKIIFKEMIPQILTIYPNPQEQSGKPTVFKRRAPEQSDIMGISDLNGLYDHIRMLDGEGYPNAFLQTENFCFEFYRASLKSDGIHADVKIRKR